MKRTAYVVMGSTGEYSDHTEWAVAVYLEKEEAERHAELANKDVAGAESWTWSQRRGYTGKNPYDVDCDIDYTGTRYAVVEVPLVGHVDEYIEEYTRQ